MIKLDGKDYHLSMHSKQGNSGAPVYVVTSEHLRGDFAKTGFSNNEYIATQAVSIPRTSYASSTADNLIPPHRLARSLHTVGMPSTRSG